MIRLIKVQPENRTLLWNIHQKYLHEMTRYYHNEMDENGNYHYGYFDAYFTEPQRKVFLIYSDNALAGFAMVNPYSYIGANPDYVLAEFSIFPAYRNNGLGMQAAKQILEMLPGSWEIKYNNNNSAAKTLWENLASEYCPARHVYNDTETVLAFSTIAQGK